jgi:hypothetical protein
MIKGLEKMLDVKYIRHLKGKDGYRTKILVFTKSISSTLIQNVGPSTHQHLGLKTTSSLFLMQCWALDDTEDVLVPCPQFC